ncbi:MYCBP-associated protein [Marchantia polymorpha subsp. ruderalis]|uniref:Uncharacterized protein n=2 Tax=Marchantia polymorpha TaxID=3197 RepID=A0AAF6BPI0_MARPO|nr:hypothetical protein MARPO_0053s0054 [Marchantia polymorpha]BBN13914.1 hypothetical protein Mp_6g07400 [Marchantia polymorpha subsp. ruderalis]|eukprot:PTQ38117.1 hypothetical protein MARPO_0053s0054 [Marchantia polymorpha]
MPQPPHTYCKLLSPEIKVVIPEDPKLKKFHVFQQLENDKETHALENWQWFEEDRPKLQESISRRINRPQDKLMMDQGFYHRMKMENAGVVDSLKRIEDRVRGETWWRMSLRNNWEMPVGVHGMCSKPENLMAQRKKEIVRIGNPDKETPKLEYFKDTSSRDQRRSNWNEFDWFIHNLVGDLHKEHPFYPNFKGLQIRGKAIHPYSESPDLTYDEGDYDERYADFRDSDDEKEREILPYEPYEPRKEVKKGPAADISTPHLLFCCKPGKIDERTVTVKNRGTTAIFYSWERRPVEPLVLPGRQKEGWRLFTVMRGTGSLLPGYARKFTFKYSSREVGTHLEKWVCRIYPRLEKPVEVVDLKGVTMFEDRLRKWRNAFTRALEYREMMTGIREAFVDILNTAGKNSRPPEELRNQEYLYTKAAFDFIRNNLAVNPPIFFAPIVFKELEKLAQVVSATVPKAPDPPPEEVVVEEETDRSRRKSKKDKKDKKDKKEKKKRKDTTSDEQDGETPDNQKKSRRKKSKSDAAAASSEAEAEPEADKEDAGKKSRRKSSKSSPEGDAEPSADKKEKKSRRKGSKSKSETATASETENGSAGAVASSPPQPDGRAVEVSPAAWAGSVSSILEAINCSPERQQRRQLKKQLNALLETAAVPNHQTSLLLMAMYKSLSQISSDVENVLETITEETGRPIVEQLLQKYYAQIEAEQAAAESVQGSDAGEDPDDMTWPFKDDDSETDWLPEEEKNLVKRERANDMLAFIMKWIHILTEARCVLRYGFDKCQDRISDEQSSVAAMIDQKILEYSKESSEDACWKVFDFERKKQHLQEELVSLPSCQLPNCPNCPRPEIPNEKQPETHSEIPELAADGLGTLI